MKHFVTVTLLTLVWATSAQAQNACDPAPAARTLAYAPNALSMAWSQADFTTQEPNGSFRIVDFLGEVLQGTTVVANWTLPRASAVPQSGTPANCILTTIPALAGLLPSNIYSVRVTPRNASGAPMPAVTGDRFFLPGVPAAPTGLRLLTPTP